MSVQSFSTVINDDEIIFTQSRKTIIYVIHVLYIYCSLFSNNLTIITKNNRKKLFYFAQLYARLNASDNNDKNFAQ